MRKFSITTLGCKVNQYDAQLLAQRLAEAGFVQARSKRPVDLAAIQTCCVTAVAMRKCRQAIRAALKASPHAAVLVAGCYSDYDGQRIASLLASLGVAPARMLVAGHHSISQRLERFLDSLSGGGSPPPITARGGGWPLGQGDGVSVAADSSASDVTLQNPTSIRQRRHSAVKANMPAPTLGSLRRFAGHQRAFVKVKDGCDAFCSYCIVPYTRCRVSSKPADAVVEECRRLLHAGHREIVLSGVFLGAYGRPTTLRRHWSDPPRSPLADLVRRVAALDGLWRVRLSSLEPLDLTDELLDVLASTPRVAPHLHLALQSGSPAVLRRMNRQYAPDDFRRTIDALRAKLHRPAVTTDIIVGFPGETDADFAETMEMARYARFAKIHAFPFSAIEPTAAWQLRREAPPKDVVRRRLGELGDLERQLAEDYRRTFVAQTVEALVEAAGRDESPAKPPRHAIRQAVSEHYQRIRFRAPRDADLTGQVVRLRIDAVTPDGLEGTLA